MTEQLSTVYEPKELETTAYKQWLALNAFHAEPPANPDDKTLPYCIMIPPPNVTGALHMGHALDNTLQDILIRYRRMQGYNTLWMPGTDHAGIATQTVVEKQVLAQDGKTRHELGRDELLKRIWSWKDQYGNQILDQLKGLGASCDWERTRFTLDDTCAKAVRKTFVKLFEDGLIYRGKRIVNWDPVTQTALADDEVEHQEVKGHFWHIKYPLADGSGHVVVATTRPETMLGDTAVAINPKDDRAAELVGKTIMLPLMNREIPIIADDHVKRDEGTGCLKVTPAHDPNDYAIGLRHNLEQINVMNPDASINELGGKYQGMDRYEARKAVIADLEAQGLLVKVVDHIHQVGHSYRSHAVIEPYLSDQWYVKVGPLAKPGIKAVEDGKIKFHPARYSDTYLNWLKGIRDWCISRQLWWGHRIPIWYCADCDELTTGIEDPTECQHCKSKNIEQDPDVLDTWFSSSLWPFSTLGWPEETPELKYYYPTSTLVTGRDIITLWVSRMVMLGIYNMGDVPFKDVFIHGTILDGKGERMSKSKGNGVDPLAIIDSYGADAMRFSLAQMTTESQDMRMPVTQDENGMNKSEKFDIGRNFCNKLWNASRFAMMNLENMSEKPVTAADLKFEDKWILSRLNDSIKAINVQLDEFKFSDPANSLYKFFWTELCDWYLELIKPRMRDESQKHVAQQVLALVLDGCLRLMHPFMPFITEGIFQSLNGLCKNRGIEGVMSLKSSDNLINAHWPELNDSLIDCELEQQMNQIQTVIRLLRDIRTRYQVAPRDSVNITIKAAQETANIFESQKHLIANLANIAEANIGPDVQKPANAATAVDGEVEVFVEGVVDVEAERSRLSKQLETVMKGFNGCQAKLNNENFVSRAKPEVVESEKQRLEQLREQVQTIQKNIDDLG
ncbi:MAG: valine--tRNA ligase [Phycisphaerae bacterium]|nr:valine--tRNA ligase [Phycisphaerae bacterium]